MHTNHLVKLLELISV